MTWLLYTVLFGSAMYVAGKSKGIAQERDRQDRAVTLYEKSITRLDDRRLR